MLMILNTNKSQIDVGQSYSNLMNIEINTYIDIRGSALH